MYNLITDGLESSVMNVGVDEDSRRKDRGYFIF